MLRCSHWSPKEHHARHSAPPSIFGAFERQGFSPNATKNVYAHSTAGNGSLRLGSLAPYHCPQCSTGVRASDCRRGHRAIRTLLEEMDRRERNSLLGSLVPPRNDNSDDDGPFPPSCLLVTIPTAASDLDIRSRPMPKMHLSPVFPTRLLNLNLDGTPINYR
jgi:hypothetical protein